MGCPVPKISKHHAGCSLMREPEHAATIVAAMVKAVRIPVTVKMRKGWDDNEQTAPDVARRVEQAGAAAITIHGRTARQSYSGTADWDFVARVASALTIPVFGSGDCIEPEQIVERLVHPGRGVSGVFVGRGVLRNPWILAQAQDLLEGRPARVVSEQQRGRFLLEYIELLQNERVREEVGFRHTAPGHGPEPVGLGADSPGAPRHDRWVINKVRALCSWYTKGLDNGSHLRIQVNQAQTLGELQDLVAGFFHLSAVSA
jgi:tRNA-dihydrouridine synthase B